MSKTSIPTVIVGILVILILLAYMFTFQVAFYQVAIKVHFGKAGAVITEPGLRFRWPWPVESIQHYDIRLKTLDTPEAEIKTVDGKNVIVGAYAVWKIEDPRVFYERVRTVPDAERQMRSRISQIEAVVIGQAKLSDFVSLDAAAVDKGYDELLQKMTDGVAPQLLADYGIGIQEIGIRRISLPQETTAEVFKSMQQERNTTAARYREEGKSQAAAIVARAEQDAKQILAFADRKAQEIRSAGVQASARLLAQIEDQDAEFYEWLRWLDALKASLAQKTTIFLDKDSPLFEPFVHPPVQPVPQPK